MWKVPLFDLNYDQREGNAVADVIRSKWLTMGQKTQEFEAAFSEMLGAETESVAVSSATAALHMALLALEVGSGDEVIVPAQTFVADANVVSMVGAVPVWADIASHSDWNVSIETIKPLVTEKTKAVIIVHFAGYPCDLEHINEFCKSNNIGLIEDVAHAPGASVNGKMCGAIGDIGCFSFFSNKNLSVGEGGMVTSNNSSLTKKLRALRSHGMTTLTLDRHKGRAVSYDVEQVGLNYRMDEMRAALGLVQLEKLADGNKARRQLTEKYRDLLANTSVRVAFDEIPLSEEHAYHILPVVLPETTDRMEVINHLKQQGIQTSIHYPPFWDFSAYSHIAKPKKSPVFEQIARRELTLPLYPTMTEEQVEFVVAELLEVVNG